MADAAESIVSATGGWLQREKALPRIVFTALGLLLIVTALLKVQGPSDGGLGQNTILFSPRLRFAVMEAEALLGLWLLSGWSKRPAWFFAVAFFLIVAGFSFYLGLIGQSSCGCFGRIKVRPWNAFALDVACLAALGWVRPSFRFGEGKNGFHSHRMSEVLPIAGGTVAILTICLAGVLMAGGSRPGDFLARVRGDQVTVEPPVTDMGSGMAGQKRQFTVRLHNHTDHTVKIVGGMDGCTGSVTDDLPVSIPPGESVPVTVRTGFRGTPGLFQQEFFFIYADGKEQQRILARFTGRVVSQPSYQSQTALKE